MAENQDINQNIKLNYQTNADKAQSSVDNLNVSVENLNQSQKENTKEIKKNEEGLKSFKTQLREANQELLRVSQTFGETSKEAIEAAKKVADLKDQMGFAKDLADSFNPDQKFKALGAATNIAATAMTGITGAMGLFGDQSEDTEKMLLKVQSAMAFSQAITGLSDLGDQFKTLKTVLVASYASITTAKTADTLATEANVAVENQSFLAKAKNVVVNGALSATTAVVTAAQWAWNVAVSANPVVALAVALVALIAGIAYLTKSLMESSAESERATKANIKLNNEITTLEKTTEKTNKQLEINQNQTLAMAKASGKSAEEIRKLSVELANQEFAEKKLNTVKAYSIFLEAKRVASLEDATDAQKATYERAKEFYIKQNDDLKTAVDKRSQIIRDNQVAEVQEETDARKKKIEEEKKHLEELAKKRKEAREKEAEERKKAEEKRKEEEQQSFRLAEKKYDDALAIQKDLRKKNEDALLTENEIKVNAENAEYERKKKALTDANLSIEELEKEHKRNLAILNDEYFASEAEKAIERTAEKDKEADDEAEFEKNKNDVIAKSKENLNNIINGLETTGLAKTKAGQAISKTLALTQIGIDSAVAISKASTLANAEGVAAQLAFPTFPGAGTIARVVSYASTGIQVASNIVRAKQLLSSGGSGNISNNNNSSSTNGISGNSQPNVAFQNSSENQIGTTLANNVAQQPIVKAVVVGQEVTDQQTADRNAITSNSF
jgi:hypothetical protein